MLKAIRKEVCKMIVVVLIYKVGVIFRKNIGLTHVDFR